MHPPSILAPGTCMMLHSLVPVYRIKSIYKSQKYYVNYIIN